MMPRILLVVLVMALPFVPWTAAMGSGEPLVFDSPEQQERFEALTEELRCLVCQNQSLADSDAPLAQDLRQEVLLMLREGQDDETIKRFLVERYGDFVLYRPPMQGNTLLLWIGPMLLLLGGSVFIFMGIQRRRAVLGEEPSTPDESEGAS